MSQSFMNTKFVSVEVAREIKLSTVKIWPWQHQLLGPSEPAIRNQNFLLKKHDTHKVFSEPLFLFCSTPSWLIKYKSH